MKIYSCVAALAVLWTVSGCAPASNSNISPPSSLDHEVTLRGQRFFVEMAQTPAQKIQGLQHRTHMPNDQGMWFVWERPEPLGFWMKDTLIPLDILFFDEKKTLLNIHHSVPPCPKELSHSCPLYRSAGLAKYVLEINAGQAAHYNFQPGDVAVVSAVNAEKSTDNSAAACLSLSEVENRDTPVDLMHYMNNCIQQHQWDRAVDLYHLSGVYAKFDTLRVADQTAHQAYDVLKLNFAQQSGEQVLQDLQSHLRSSVAQEGYHQQLCVEVKNVGKPSYEPTYMINHGMSAFVGGTKYVEGFNADHAWNEVLTSYLKCTV